MRPEKQLLLNEIKEKIDSSNAMIIAKYDSMQPDKSWNLRQGLSSAGSDFEVVKKRVFLKAAKECGIELKQEVLQGNIGVAFLGENTVDGTKVFYKFNKDNNDLFEVLLGRYENNMYSPDDVKALSKLPSRDEMRAQLIGLLEAPMSQTVSVMENIVTSVLYCLENKAQESN